LLRFTLGFLKKLLKRFRPLEAHDAFFGRILYMRMPKGKTSYWESKRMFSPCGGEIELFIDAPGHNQPPDEKQRNFFSWVEREYRAIVAHVELVLRPQFEQWTRNPLAKPFAEEFKLVSFSIPLITEDSAEWEMSFESTTDENHLFTVTLHGTEAKSVSIDG